MSDNSLSEEEFNALQAPDSDKLTPLLEDFFNVHTQAISAFEKALGEQVSKECSIGKPQALRASAADILGRLPEEVVDIQINFSGPYSGPHSYYLGRAEALQIALPIMGVESEDLDEATLSAIGECFSKAVNAQLDFINKKFKKSFAQDPHDVKLAQKDSLNLKAPVFTLLYDISLDGEKVCSVTEVINEDLAESIGKIVQGDIVEDSSSKNKVETPKAEGVNFPNFRVSEIGPQEERNLGLLMDVPVTLTVELGRTKWQLRDVLTIGEGSIIELQKQAGEPVDVLVNNNLVARGEVVVVDENFSVRITEIITSFEQMMQKGL